jgi:hypothetical protein
MMHAPQNNASASDIDTRTVFITLFKDKTAQTMGKAEHSLPALRDYILATSATTKKATPWLKLAKFGNKRTEKKCLRHDANVTTVSGIECDYDDETISFEAAVEIMRKANVRCLLYTSASHTPETPRWRVLVPFSKEYPPATRAPMVGRINGLFNGSLAPESFVLSTSYHYGSVNHNPHHQAVVLDGGFLDLNDRLHAGSIDKQGHRVGQKDFEQAKSTSERTREPGNPFSAVNANPADKAEIIAALAVINTDCGHRLWYKLASAIWYELRDEGEEVFHTFSARSAKYNETECGKKWREAVGNTTFTAGTIFYCATLASPDWRGKQSVDEDEVEYATVDDIDDDDDDGVDLGASSSDDERVANEAPVAKKLQIIKIKPRISVVTSITERMLVTVKVPFYQRSGELVRPIITTVKAAHGHLTKTAQLKAVSPTYMRDTMCRHSIWKKFDGRKNVGRSDGADQCGRDVTCSPWEMELPGNRRRNRDANHAARWDAIDQAGLRPGDPVAVDRTATDAGNSRRADAR